MNLHGVKQMVPKHMRVFVGRSHISGVLIFPGECKGMFFILALPDSEINLFGCTGLQVEV